MKKIVLIGAGGHAKSCLEVINSKKEFKVNFLIDRKYKVNSDIKTVLESDFIKKNSLNRKNIHISVGQLKDGRKRKKIYEFYKSKGCTFPVVKSSSCYISKKSTIGEGTIIMHKVLININVKIGKNCIINSGSIVEHDAVIGDNVHIAPGAIILGGCHISNNSFIGSGSIIKQNTTIRENSILSSVKYFKE